MPTASTQGSKTKTISLESEDLRIGRFFTTAGVHPYDEIEWEQRDSVIKNYKTGALAFEQLGVEVPKSWSQNATNIAAQKYFRGSLGTPERERSVKQMIDRVVNRYHEEGLARGYFADDEEASTFKDELTHLLVTQKAAFNSPVWFNVGWRPKGEEQVSACFILSVEDEMRSILNWYTEEGLIFKHGSGSGLNLSTLRSSKERLKSGGTASGPVSFMRGADASAGTIKSGGATRRAAKMVVLNVDHPDVKEFIWCKALEERKARALREAGFDMDLDGADSHSIQYQNANNSVRVTDEFMEAVVEDRDWDLKAVTNGETIESVPARKLFREITEAAWECADPGMQYDTTINDWHTAANSGRINASNPCFPGDARVHTDKGLVRFDDLLQRVQRAETFEVYTHGATHPDEPFESVVLSSPTQFMVTGVNEVLRLEFSDGRVLRCTPNHRIWTENRGWARADELTEEDQVKTVAHATPATMASYAFPVSSDLANYTSKGDKSLSLNLPEKWDEDFAHYLGWLIGDGSISGNVVSTIYGSEEDREEVLPRHLELLTRINGGRAPKPSVQSNGTVQLRMSRRPFRLFLEALGVGAVRAHEKRIPESVFQAPDDIAAAFLRGLFDADGCAVDSEKARYAGLGSVSKELLRDVQLLLTRFGVTGSIYSTKRTDGAFRYVRKDGSEVSYESRQLYDLRISGHALGPFFGIVGFDLERKLFKLEGVIAEHSRYRNRSYSKLVARESDGFELTYNLTEPLHHSYMVNGVVVSNCSEYMHVDNSSCNLASLNLLKFTDEDGNFDIEAYKHAVEVVFLAQEISVGFASYPTEAIAENSRKFRQLGQGFANLGALLMTQGLPYDSDEGRAWAGSLMAIMTGHCYATSAKVAKRVGTYEEYETNREPHLRVMNKHRDAAYEILDNGAPVELATAARKAWDEAVALGEKHGYRNAQATVLAPTGTIGLLMDCDTTGIEPDLALKKMKKLVGGGTMSIVNRSVPRALGKLGYTEQQIGDIISYIDENAHVIDAPHLLEEHLPVFDTAMGDRSIHYMGHVKMMSAVQPFISGAISKTVNLPEEVTVEDVEQVYIEGWRSGLKALAVYRDNCKVGQPLSTDGKKKAAEVKPSEDATPVPVRRRLPKQRRSMTFKFRVADTEGYLTAGEFPDGHPGEIFLRVAKQGSTLAGVMDAFAISISMGLQYGVPLSAYVKQFCNTRFEPSGMTDDPDFRIATSILDYVFRRLAAEYLDEDERRALGIRTAGERQAEIENKLAEDETANGNGHSNGNGNGNAQPPKEEGVIVLGPVASASTGSRPYCGTCGIEMVPSGSCFACTSCGSTSGCS